MKRPPIAVAGRVAAAGRVSRSAISFAGRVYLDAVLRAGGEPLTLSPRELRHDEARQLLRGFKALVLMGGADVDPHLYGQQRQPHVPHRLAPGGAVESGGFLQPLVDGEGKPPLCGRCGSLFNG